MSFVSNVKSLVKIINQKTITTTTKREKKYKVRHSKTSNWSLTVSLFVLQVVP